ncbi:hypothetical protein BGZ98_002445, partial [Dissophora globulifera]
MRPPAVYDAAQAPASKRSPTSLRLRPRRRSLIGRSRAVPFLAGSLGSLRRRSEDGADDQLIVSLRDRHAADSQMGTPLQSNAQALQEYLMVLTPQRLPYEIQMASGWDKGYPPEELVGLMQKSSGKGWHTPRFCGYPQDLVLRFSCGHSRIRKIQILSHQYKIASRLDFWMGSRKGMLAIPAHDLVPGSSAAEYRDTDHDDNNNDDLYPDEDDGLDLIPRMEPQKSLPVLQFQKLGSISFDSNSASNYSGRELKSINVDVEGEYLRVVIRQCHVNPLNIYHQVAILALNVLGEPLEDELHGESERVDFDDYEVVNGPGQGLSESSLAHSVAHSLISPVDTPDVPNISDAVRSLSIAENKDQSVSYLDQDVQKLVSGFVKAKLDAVKVEDFASAKMYKSGYENMIKFADEIQELDIEKHRAAENDDFDLAQELKAKVIDIKSRMHSQLSLDGFYISASEECTLVSLTPLDAIEEEDIEGRSLTLSKSYSSGNMLSLMDSRNTSGSMTEANGKRSPVNRRSIPAPSSLVRSASTTSDNSSDPDKVKRSSYVGRIPAPLASRPHSSSVSRTTDTRYLGLQSRLRSASTPKTIPRVPHSASTMSNIVHQRSIDPSSHSTMGRGDTSSASLAELTEQEQISFEVSLQVFPSKIVSFLLSRELNLRLYAIEHVKEYLENESVADDIDQQTDSTLITSAVLQVISIALTDTREKVVTLTLTMLDQVVKFCLQNEIPSSAILRSLEPIFTLLLIKASDLNARVAQGSIDRIVMLCNCFRAPPHAILPLVFKPARNTVLYRQSQSRVEVVARLVDEFGVFDHVEGKGTAGGLDFENITEFAVPYLSHTNGEVRVAARKLIIDVCKFLNKTRVEQFLPGVKPLIIESIQKELVPRKAKAVPLLSSPTPSRPLSSSSMTAGQSPPSVKSPMSPSGSIKRRQAPATIGVDLHMDSLKSLLVEPDSPGLNRSGRPNPRQRSDIAIAHQARVKQPLRSSIKATQAMYSGVSRSMIKRQSALSPDEENDSTASDEIKPTIPRGPAIAPKTAVRPLQPKSKSSSPLSSKSSRQDLTSAQTATIDGQRGRSGEDPGLLDELRSAKDRFCVFCDERSSAFTDEGLVVHYWNDCAMLANCSYCKIIIEVPTLADHMLKECAKRKFVKQCDNCREIMAADSYLAHIATGCFAVPDTTVRCPLCHLILESNDEAEWKQHLLLGSGCPMNKKSSAQSMSQRKSRLSLGLRSAGNSVTNLLPPVNTSSNTATSITAATAGSVGVTTASLRGNVNVATTSSSMVPTGSPTSPLSSSSSSSMRIDSSSGRHRSALFSATVSPASSTTSSVIDKSGILPPGAVASLASLAGTSPHVGGQRTHPATAASPTQGEYSNYQLLDSVHPLDPSPIMLTHSPSPCNVNTLQQQQQAGSPGNGSRIPKLGGLRSSSSNA